MGENVSISAKYFKVIKKIKDSEVTSLNIPHSDFLNTRINQNSDSSVLAGL